MADTGCYVEFPLNIPVGRTIDQIAIFHSTDSNVMNPSISASVVARGWTPLTVDQKFPWTSTAYVPDGTVDKHKLMLEHFIKGFLTYTDKFQVAPDTTYNVILLLMNNAAVQGLQVTYE